MKSTLTKIPTQRDIPYQEVVTDGQITINKDKANQRLDDIWEGGYDEYEGTGTLTVKFSQDAVKSALQVLFPWDMWVVHDVYNDSGTWKIKATQAHNFFEFVRIKSNQNIQTILINAIKKIWKGTIRYSHSADGRKVNLRWWFKNKKYEPFFSLNPSTQNVNSFNPDLLIPFKPIVTGDPNNAKAWLILTTYQPWVDPADPETMFDNTVFTTIVNQPNKRGNVFDEEFVLIDYDDQTTLSPPQIVTLPDRNPTTGEVTVDFTCTIPSAELDLNFIKVPIF